MGADSRTLEAGLTYLRAGLSAIPIRRDGSKAPALEWKPYSTGIVNDDGEIATAPRLATEAEARSWWGNGKGWGVGVVGGAISGNLEHLDFDKDSAEVFPAWCELVEIEAPGLLDRLSIRQTPRQPPGYHVSYRCVEVDIPGNTVIAERPNPDYDPKKPKGPTNPERLKLIETRGTGGQCVAPGTPAHCHENNAEYKHFRGVPLSQVPTITAAEREILWRNATSFHAVPAGHGNLHGLTATGEGARPGDDFNVTGVWADILTGWECVLRRGEVGYWRRPGKDVGWSATTDFCTSKNGVKLLKVFSTNAEPFEGGQTYSRFAAYALLHHNGDFSQAASALAGQYKCDENRVANEPAKACTNCTTPSPSECAPVVHIPQVPFPVEALPAAVRAFVVEGAAALRCDPSYFALPALSAMAVAAGTTRRLQLKGTWREFPILWTCVIGRSSSLKTPAFDMTMQPLYRIQKALLEQWEKDYDEWEREAAAWDKAKKPEGPRPKKPIKPRVVVSDATVEAVGSILAENPRGVLLARDELSGWVKSFSQYKANGKGDDCQKYMEMHSGRSMTIDRKTGEDRKKTLLIERAALSVAGGIQPRTMARLATAELFESGLIGRLCVAMPMPPRKQWSEDEISPETQLRYETAMHRLLDLDFEDDKEFPHKPYLIHLAPDARRLWIDYYNAIGGAQDDTEDEDKSALLGKLEGAAARLAIVHHLVTEADANRHKSCSAVTAESMQAAITLAKWFAQEGDRVYGMVKESEGQRGKRTLVEFIERRGGSVNASDLVRANRKRWPSAKAAKDALELLVKNGVAKWQGQEAKATGPTPVDRCVLI